MYTPKDIYKNVNSSTVCKNKMLETTHKSINTKWINKWRHVPTAEYRTGNENVQTTLHAITWMTLMNITMSKRSQARRSAHPQQSWPSMGTRQAEWVLFARETFDKWSIFLGQWGNHQLEGAGLYISPPWGQSVQHQESSQPLRLTLSKDQQDSLISNWAKAPANSSACTSLRPWDSEGPRATRLWL